MAQPRNQQHAPPQQQQQQQQKPATRGQDQKKDAAPDSQKDDAAVDVDELEALVAIAMLDLEAAGAYRIVGDMVEDSELKDSLLEFAGDHERHAREISELVASTGMKAELTAPDPARSAMLQLASALGGLEASAAVDCMLANEQLTNATYESAMELVMEPRAARIVRRAREDERRHLEALTRFAKSDVS